MELVLVDDNWLKLLMNFILAYVFAIIALISLYICYYSSN